MICGELPAGLVDMPSRSSDPGMNGEGLSEAATYGARFDTERGIGCFVKDNDDGDKGEETGGDCPDRCDMVCD